jgi:hypothetical protein
VSRRKVRHFLHATGTILAEEALPYAKHGIAQDNI